MTYPKDLCGIAERVVWFERAEETLRYPKRFLAYLKYFSDEDFQEVLLDAPAGIFDARSWSYWNSVYKNNPTPPLPFRTIPHQNDRS